MPLLNNTLRKKYPAEWAALKNAIHRCHNDTHIAYPNYGARGILVSEELRDDYGLSRLIDAIGPRPSSNHSLERVDNNRGYEVGSNGNLRWATRQEQQLNRRPSSPCEFDLGWGIGWVEYKTNGYSGFRRSPLLPFHGALRPLAEWAPMLNLKSATIRQRLKRGLTPQEALSKPANRLGTKPRIARNSLFKSKDADSGQ
jgi:hypothetical protein